SGLKDQSRAGRNARLYSPLQTPLFNLKSRSETVSIVGMGYVGLCTAATFASRSIRTVGIDIDEARVEQIRRGKAPLHEPQLDTLLKQAVKSKLLEATSDISRAFGTDTTFLKEGTAINDALHPDKIIIGSNDKKSANRLKRLYRKFYGPRLPPVILTSPESAELVKYASNAFLATKVSFINTVANIAQQIPGVDVGTIAEAIGLDPRIGGLFLKAGPGYGGSCFHKDLQALINYSKNNGYDSTLFRATEETNEQQSNKVVDMAEALLGSLSGKRDAVLGLAFKKDTDDIRAASSFRVIIQLKKKGVHVIAYDPMA